MTPHCLTSRPQPAAGRTPAPSIHPAARTTVRRQGRPISHDLAAANVRANLAVGPSAVTGFEPQFGLVRRTDGSTLTARRLSPGCARVAVVDIRTTRFS